MPLTPTPQSVYQNASNFTIGMQNLTIHNGPSAPRIGRNEPPQPIPDASHHRNRKSSPPDSSCLPGTREGVITKIISWAKDDNPDHAQIALWLCGAVGSGKSAISQAVAEALDRCNRLAASFFFFRGSGDRSRFAKVPITLASQMAAAIPETAPYVMDAVERMVGWSVSKQMEELVYKPIQLALADEGHGEVVSMVLDGLDECEDKEEVEEFIDHLLEYLGESPSLPLRFIIASRIEQHIQGRLESEHVEIENLSHHFSHDDVRKFLLASFSRAARQSRVIRAYGKWPTNTEVATLLSHIRGSFIFASTIVKYILSASDDGLTPMERLPLALKMNPGLDGLYAETLKRCSHFPLFTDTLATIVLSVRSLSISQLSRLLGIPTFKILNILLHLQAVIHVPGDDNASVTVFHTSFLDFLTDANRSHRFFIPPCHHERLAFKWLDALCYAPTLEDSIGDVGADLRKRTIAIYMIVQRHVSDAWYHYRQDFRVEAQGENDPPTLAFVQAFVNRCCLSSPSETGEHIPWFIKHVPFCTMIFHMIGGNDRHPEELTSLRDIDCDPPSHCIPHYGNVASILVHTGILCFNRCMHVDQHPLSVKYLLRHWVKHLAAAVEGDPGLTLEFLRTRSYEPIEHECSSIFSHMLEGSDSRSRIYMFNFFLGSWKGIMELKADVLAAQKAVENRFPGALPILCSVNNTEVFQATLDNAQGSDPSSGAEQSDGISVLDVFNAYRKFAQICASMLDDASGREFTITTFIHRRRKRRRDELWSVRDLPVGQLGSATKETPVDMIIFTLHPQRY